MNTKSAFDGDLTEGMEKFMRSDGQDRSGLTPEQVAEVDTQAPQGGADEGPDDTPPVQQPAPGAPPAGQGEPEPDDPDLVLIDERGVARRKQGQFASKKGYVPHEALHAERTARKRFEEEARRAREESIAIRERARLLEEMVQSAAKRATGVQEDERPENPFEEEDIDPQVDIFGSNDQLRRRVAYQQQQQTELMSGMQRTSEEQSLAANAKADTQQFAQVQPDFWQAYYHLLNSRGRELEALGYSKEQATAMLKTEEMGMVRMAQQRGQRPAEFFYRIATARGWRPEMMQSAPNPAANGAHPPPQQPVQPPVNPRLQQQQQTRAQFTSLSSAGGAPTSGFTADMLSRMGQDEFMRKVSELSPEEYRRIMGG